VCRTPGPKHIGLASDDDGPLAIVPFLEHGAEWQPLLHWILPATLGLHRGGDPLVACPRLTKTHVGWWRQPTAPPRSSLFVYNVQRARSYGMSLDRDPTPHWKSSGHWRTLKTSRNRCAGYTFKVNAPGMAAWTIRRWEEHWRTTTGGQYAEQPYRLVAAEDLERRGLHDTLTLHDGDEPVAGHTFVRHAGDVVWQLTYRAPAYEARGVGTALLELAWQWAQSIGARNIDLGGHHAYKSRWAPERGDRWEFDFTHPAVRTFKAGARRVRKRLGGLRARS
jgi:GNAT superfamily N-acetyltransferase